MQYTKQEVETILDKHGKWLRCDEDGKRAYLSDADLSGAGLSRADLRDANLRGASLRDADLRGADLSRAYLRDANLRDANLRGASLRDADLRGADLSGADLSRAYLRDANLRGADLSRADLRDANLRGANLRGATGLPYIGQALNMADWHTCDTTHCRAGWAIHLHPAGKTLESIFGPSAAGALIYNACSVREVTPDWHASDDDAMADIRECAARGPGRH
jgi:hypothetical protein